MSSESELTLLVSGVYMTPANVLDIVSIEFSLGVVRVVRGVRLTVAVTFPALWQLRVIIL